jgi:hypothetical protein
MRSGVLFSIIVILNVYSFVLASGGDMGVGTEPMTNGSEAYPWLIEDLSDFDAFAGNSAYWAAGVHTKLMTDIDLSGRVYSTAVIASETDWRKWGFQGVTFNGNFEGNNYEILNVTIDFPHGNYIGIFGYISSDGKVRNLNIETVNIIESSYYTGGLAGYNEGSISNCAINGRINGSESRRGGLVGCNRGLLNDCYASVAVTGSGGGLVGENYQGVISSCCATGNIIGYSVGGLVGENKIGAINQGIIQNCYATGSVTALSPIGAIAHAGGLVGSSTGGEISYCYSTGEVKGPIGGWIGGLIGAVDDDTTFINNFWDTESSDKINGVGNDSPDPTGIKGKTTSQMQMLSTFTIAYWDFFFETENGTEDIWFIREGVHYPKLWWQHHQPIADAGEDVTAYAWVDGYVEIKLNGTGSYDADGVELEYFWYNDANELIATGAEPNVLFGAGEYVIHLIVNDGIDDSEPDTCEVTVIKAIEAEAKLTPQSLNRKSNRPHVIGRLELDGISAADIDLNEPMVLMPGNIEAERVDISGPKKKGESLTMTGFFDNAAFMEAVEQDGDVEVTIAAKLLTGQWVYGRDVVTVK